MKLNNLGSLDDDFSQIYCETNGCTVYSSIDPRLKTKTGEMMPLDSIPRNGKIKTNTACGGATEGGTGSCGLYANYSHIQTGDITYYVNEDMSTPFLPINFPTKNVIIKQNYIDPMGTRKLHFERCPVERNTDPACNTWLRDSTAFREELMALNLARINQNNFQVQ